MLQLLFVSDLATEEAFKQRGIGICTAIPFDISMILLVSLVHILSSKTHGYYVINVHADVCLLPDSPGPQDWSDHGLWWPERHIWLRRPRITLQAYGIESDSRVQFTSQNKPLKVKLPDRTVVRMKVNLACECFQAVEQVGSMEIIGDRLWINTQLTITSKLYCLLHLPFPP